MLLKMNHLRFAILAAMATSVYAEQQKHHFDIPAQSLSSALQKFATQSGAPMLYAEQIAAGKQNKSLVGDYTIAEALSKLLTGSGLDFKIAENGTVTIKRQEVSLLKPVSVVGNREYDATDPYNPDYVLPNATAGTKTDTPIMETPLNVQVITKQVLKDQQVINMADALKNVSGVTTGSADMSGSLGNTNQQIFLRGFASEVYFRNGFRLTEGAGQRDTTNLESIEVLKGPASILYGLVEPGGMVNVITKQPLATPYYSAQQQFGSYNLYRTTLDATGPLTKDNTLLYRMNISYENSGSFRQFINDEKIFVAPVLKWNISPKTQATLEFEYSHNNLGIDSQFIPTSNGAFLPIPRSLNYGEPGSANHNDIYFGAFNWSHKFTEDWSIKHSVSVNQNSMNRLAVSSFSPQFSPTLDQVDRELLNYKHNYNNYATNIDLTGHFDTGLLNHTLLFGGDYYRYDLSINRMSSAFDPNNPFANDNYIGIYNPIHPGMKYDPVNGVYIHLPSGTANGGMVLDPTSLYHDEQHIDQYGIYLQDQIKLPYNFNFTGGFRYQNLHSTVSDQLYGAPATNYSALTADKVTPRFGLLWRPQDWLSLYSNYVQNFGPNYGTIYPNTAVPPASAQQWEVGFKNEFFDKKLRTTFAYYNLTKQNVASADPNPDHLGFSIVTGAVRSRGPELDIQGEILPGWNITANYTNIDIVVTKGNVGDYPAEGSRYWGVPRNMGSVWNTYEFQNPTLKGFKIGGGVTLRDSQLALTNSGPEMRIPGYGTVDLMAAYSHNIGKSKVSAQLNITNILDKYYYTGAGFGSSPVPVGYDGCYAGFGAPRMFMGSIKIEF